MRDISAVSNQEFVILLTGSDTLHNDTRNDIDYFLCIISIPIIFYCNCTTTRLLYVGIFTAAMAQKL